MGNTGISTTLFLMYALWQLHNLLPGHRLVLPNDSPLHPHYAKTYSSASELSSDDTSTVNARYFFHHPTSDDSPEILYPPAPKYLLKTVTQETLVIPPFAFRLTYPKIPPDTAYPADNLIPAPFTHLSSVPHRGPPAFIR